MNRGSLPAMLRRDAPEPRFNEAPIHESGKYCGRGWLAYSFLRASMRPRFMNRGSAAEVAQLVQRPALQ